MRAIGIIRVSKVRGREGESFASPEVQRQRIEAACHENGWRLETVHEEMDVKGGTPLGQRKGLLSAVEAVEAGEIHVIVGGYFDRLLRSTDTLADMRRRVEAAGGGVYSVDHGWLTSQDAMGRFQTNLQAGLAEFYARQIGEKARAAAVRAAERGVQGGRVPIGYVRGADGRLLVDPELAPVARRMFEMRVDGASLAQIGEMLKSNGCHRWPSAVNGMIASRVYLGEVKYGETVTPDAHEALISPELWRRAQRATATPGRKGKSERLLARLGILRCSGCGRHMCVASGSSPRYRCVSGGSLVTCPAPVTINADIAEQVVVEAVKQILVGAAASASADDAAQEAQEALRAAQEELDGAMRGFTVSGLLSEPVAVERLRQLREARDAAQIRADDIEVTDDITVTVDDWEELSCEGQRALIKAVIERVEVAPGAGRGGVRNRGDWQARARERVSVIDRSGALAK